MRDSVSAAAPTRESNLDEHFWFQKNLFSSDYAVLNLDYTEIAHIYLPIEPTYLCLGHKMVCGVFAATASLQIYKTGQWPSCPTGKPA